MMFRTNNDFGQTLSNVQETLGFSASRWHHITVLSFCQRSRSLLTPFFPPPSHPYLPKFTFHAPSRFQGADIFAAKINIEVQRASEGAIAAIEKNGGVISTGFYDPISLGN